MYIKADRKSQKLSYCIRPNYSTVGLDFLKLLNKLVVKYRPNKGTFQRKISRGLHEEQEHIKGQI